MELKREQVFNSPVNHRRARSAANKNVEKRVVFYDVVKKELWYNVSSTENFV